MSRIALRARLAVVVLLALLAGAIVSVRAARLELPSGVLAAIAAGLVAAASAAVAVALIRAARGEPGRAARLGEAALFVGLLLVVGAGLSNWAFAYRGYVVLTEGEESSIDGGLELQELSAGPLARVGELEGRLRLSDVRLAPVQGGGFVPESSLVLTRPDGSKRSLVVTPDHGAAVGPTLLHQGAFGFVPRVVVQKGTRVLLDRTQPFTSRRRGPTGVAFEETLEVGEGVVLVAAIDLGSLDEAMKGHPRLAVSLRRGEEILGAGTLSPGHGATLKDGWHVGFGTLKKWSEIGLSRRSYRGQVLAGLALALLGALSWGVAVWGRKRATPP